jgi:hypothetical protein
VRYLRYLHREKGHEHRRSEPASQPARERERERGRKRERERERELVYVRMRKMTAPSYSSGNVEVHSVKFRLSPPHNVLGYSSLSRLRPSQCHTGRKKIAKGMDARKRKMRRRDTTRQDKTHRLENGPCEVTITLATSVADGDTSMVVPRFPVLPSTLIRSLRNSMKCLHQQRDETDSNVSWSYKHGQDVNSESVNVQKRCAGLPSQASEIKGPPNRGHGATEIKKG